MAAIGLNEEWRLGLQRLREAQHNMLSEVEGEPRCPKEDDFENLPANMSIRVLRQRIDRPISHCIMLLYQNKYQMAALEDLALRVQEEFEESACVMLTFAVESILEMEGCCSLNSDRALDDRSLQLYSTILMEVLAGILIKKCRLRPRSIILFGCREAGTACLAMAAIWDHVEFGGVVTVDGPMSDIDCPLSGQKPATPALVLRGTRSVVDGTAFNETCEYFDCININDHLDGYDMVPGKDQMQPILDFLGHRLRHDEWSKQAVICFGMI